MYDVVDVLRELNKEFKHLKFIIETQTRKLVGRYEVTENVLKISEAYGNTYSPAVKTSLVFRENEEINEVSLIVIQNRIREFLPKVSL